MNPFSPRPERQHYADQAEFLPTYMPPVDASVAELKEILIMFNGSETHRRDVLVQHQEVAGRMATAGSHAAPETPTAVQQTVVANNVYDIHSARRSVAEHVDSSADIEAKRVIQGEEQRVA